MIMTTAMDRNVRMGSRRPSRKIMTDTMPNATRPPSSPISTHRPRPSPNDSSDW